MSPWDGFQRRSCVCKDVTRAALHSFGVIVSVCFHRGLRLLTDSRSVRCGSGTGDSGTPNTRLVYWMQLYRTVSCKRIC
ncbi:Uncharacterized protein DAT39_021569 [Clarias magur]|uniref:Uncharacterized protein n=1 Tax=Clarias magur TaxID=1594786 RepID=A0A8J4U0Z0_CLAMG|nr:Uncharacterized protein DAT39_021569 [Clarias magur]